MSDTFRSCPAPRSDALVQDVSQPRDSHVTSRQVPAEPPCQQPSILPDSARSREAMVGQQPRRQATHDSCGAPGWKLGAESLPVGRERVWGRCRSLCPVSAPILPAGQASGHHRPAPPACAPACPPRCPSPASEGSRSRAFRKNASMPTRCLLHTWSVLLLHTWGFPTP